MSELLCKSCGEGPLNWLVEEPTLDSDMSCQQCGQIYHGISGWNKFDMKLDKELDRDKSEHRAHPSAFDTRS